MRIDINEITSTIKGSLQACQQNLAYTQADLREYRRKVNTSPAWRDHHEAMVADLEHNEAVWAQLVAAAQAKQNLREAVERL